MGQKVHPNGLRVGVIKDWNSKWYADDKNFSDYLVEDYKIRKFVKNKLFVSGISKIEIERTAKFVRVNVYTAKPGLVIGKGGNLAEELKNHSFFLCSVSYLVNLKYITTIKGNEVTLGEETVYISRSKKKDFLQAVNEYVGKGG